MSACVVTECTYSASDGSAYCTLHGVKWGRGPEPSYLCNCGESFREHLARVVHAATCPTMLARRCPSVLPSSADAPHERTGWDGPVRCVLSRDHEGDRHWNSGINWREVVTPSQADREPPNTSTQAKGGQGSEPPT